MTTLDAKSSRVAIITAITGQYDRIKEPLYADPRLTYLCFVDVLPSPQYQRCSVWQFKHIDTSVHVPLPSWCQVRPRGHHESDAYESQCRFARNMYRAKYIKIMHFVVPCLKRYDVVVWMDGSFQCTNPTLRQDAINAVTPEKPLAVYRHSRWARVLDDVLYCSNANNDYAYLTRRYTGQDMLMQYLHYVRKGFADRIAFECGIVVSRPKDPRVQRFMRAWWRHNVTYTYQDQISFGYLRERHAMPVNVLGCNIYQNTLVGHHHAHHVDQKKKQQPKPHPKKQKQASSTTYHMSFDCFDTLVTRLCGHPHTVFTHMAQQWNKPAFARARQNIEASNPRTYTLCGYYDQLVTQYPQWKHYCDAWKRYELVLEHALGVPVARALRQYQNAQNTSSRMPLIVSDTYWTREQVWQHLGMHGVFPLDPGQVWVSYGGKRDGTMWATLKKQVSARLYHVGDNMHSDVMMAKKAGLRTKLFTDTLKDHPIERLWRQARQPQSATFCRAMRLNVDDGSTDLSVLLSRLVVVHWLPVLLHCARAIHAFKEYHACPLILFQSRDMYCLKMLYDALYPKDTTRYLYISRVAMRNVTAYTAYFKTMFTPHALIVDLQGTGRSFATFVRDTQAPITDFWYISLFCDRPKVEDARFVRFYEYYNDYLERLNYADHGSVIGVRMPGAIPHFFDKEYDEATVEPILTTLRRIAFYARRYRDALVAEPPLASSRALLLIQQSMHFTNAEKTLLNRIQHVSNHDLPTTLPHGEDTHVFKHLFHYALQGRYWLSQRDHPVTAHFERLGWECVSLPTAMTVDVLVCLCQDAFSMLCEHMPRVWQILIVPWALSFQQRMMVSDALQHWSWRMVRTGVYMRLNAAQKNHNIE